MKLLLLLATTSLVLGGGLRREKRQMNYYGGDGNNYPQGRANVQVTHSRRSGLPMEKEIFGIRIGDKSITPFHSIATS